MKLYHKLETIFVIRNLKTKYMQIVDVDHNEIFKYQDQNISPHYLYLMCLGIDDEQYDGCYDYQYLDYIIRQNNK